MLGYLYAPNLGPNTREVNTMEDTTVKTRTIWVTETGNCWGTSGDIHTASTEQWTEDDWQEFEEASNEEKWEVFRYLARKYELTVTTFTP